MATKEDILEQVVEEHLLHKGYFVRHNVKFKPDKEHKHYVVHQDSNHSDIDVLAYNPKRRGANKVWAVSCKSWQGGFRPKAMREAIEKEKVINGRETWKGFRELVKPKWSEAFINTIEKNTGTRQFTYITAVTKVLGTQDDKEAWENHKCFKKRMEGNPIKIITFEEMVEEIKTELSTTLAATEVGRLLQLFQANNLLQSDR